MRSHMWIFTPGHKLTQGKFNSIAETLCGVSNIYSMHRLIDLLFVHHFC